MKKLGVLFTLLVACLGLNKILMHKVVLFISPGNYKAQNNLQLRKKEGIENLSYTTNNNVAYENYKMQNMIENKAGGQFETTPIPNNINTLTISRKLQIPFWKIKT